MIPYRQPRRRTAAFRAVLAAAPFASASILLGTAAAQAAELPFPYKPIRLIVATGTGGPNDLFARLVAPTWGEALGRQIVIDNRAGAGGQIGTEIDARALPDGYTQLVGIPGPLIIGPLMSDNPPYNVLKDFEPESL